MITINNLEILNQGKQLAIDVETNPGFNITSLLIWSVDDFKDYNLAKDMSSKLRQINNREVLIINSADLNLHNIEDIVFVEIESNYVDEEDNCCDNCDTPVLGIAYDLSKYYRCLMSYILDMGNSKCTTCNDNEYKDVVTAINLMIDTTSKAIDAGYYLQAIDMINNLKQLCKLKECINCEEIICNSCTQFKQH